MRASVNGVPVDAPTWRSIALTSYGHFTSLLVRDGAAQGWDLHLRRLLAANQELFGSALDSDAIREWLRGLIGGESGIWSVRISAFSPTFKLERPGDAVPADVLITATPDAPALLPPLSVATVHYQRDAPHIKHAGTFGLMYQKRQAQLRGFDDALFVDASGAVSEGSVWNVGFLDGDDVVWPDAPMLDGVSMRLLQCGLAELGVRSRRERVERGSLAGFRGAFFSNSRRAIIPIRRIDDVHYIIDSRDASTLQRALDTQPWLPLQRAINAARCAQSRYQPNPVSGLSGVVPGSVGGLTNSACAEG